MTQSKSRPTTVETLLWLDVMLKHLAAQRVAAAVSDDIAKAEDYDRQWHIFDEDRQNLIARGPRSRTD